MLRPMHPTMSSQVRSTVRSKSTSSGLALEKRNGFQSRNSYKLYEYVFSNRVVSHWETSFYVPRSSQVVNGNHIRKYSNYYQFIMKAEGMKNHGIRIMHAQQTLSPVSYTWGFSMKNLQLDLEHLLTMNSLSFSMISSLVEFIINLRCSTLSPVAKPGSNSVYIFPFQSSLFKVSPLCVC
jgi:hypothetical protein